MENHKFIIILIIQCTLLSLLMLKFNFHKIKKSISYPITFIAYTCVVYVMGFFEIHNYYNQEKWYDEIREWNKIERFIW
jgi:hypothetical protein